MTTAPSFIQDKKARETYQNLTRVFRSHGATQRTNLPSENAVIWDLERNYWDVDVAVKIYEKAGQVYLSFIPIGSCPFSSATYPLSDWSLGQTIDDGNLLTTISASPSTRDTTIASDTQVEFAIRGPPGRKVANSINLFGVEDNKFLIES